MRVALLVSCSVLALLFTASAARAQTATATLVWDQAEPVATVQTFQTFVKIGAAAATAVTPTCVAHVQAATQTTCTVPLAGGAPPSGTQVTVTESNGAGLAATTITAGGGPASPANVKITIIVTVP